MTTTSTDTDPIGRTQCQTAQFLASGNGVQLDFFQSHRNEFVQDSIPTICGTNTGYHMLLPADDACNQLSVAWTSGTQSWNIRVGSLFFPVKLIKINGITFR